MAFRTQKISQMTPKGANLEATDLIEVSTIESGSYVTRSITGQEIIDGIPPAAAAWGSITGTLSSQTDLQSALNAKQDTLTLTTTGTSGAATLVGSTLNIPQYSGGASGITIGTTAITSGTVGRILFEGAGNVVQESGNLFWDNTNNRLGINTSTPTNPLSVYRSGSANYWNFEPSATGTAPFIQAFFSGGFDLRLNLSTGTSIGGLSIAQGMAIYNNSATSNAGLVVGSIGATNGIIAVTGSNANVHIASSGGTSSILSFRENTAANRGVLGYQNGTTYMQIRTNAATDFTNGTLSTAFFSTGNVGINTTTDAGFRLDVNGTARVQGQLTAALSSNAGANPNLLVQTTNGDSSVLRVQNTEGSCFITTNNGVSNFTNNTIALSMQLGFRIADGAGGIGAISSAILEVTSTTKGFLPPRMTTTEKNAIATPAAGLMVYDTTLNVISYYNGTMWV